jgi:hypothetical protein
MSQTFNNESVRHEVAIGLLESQIADVSEAMGVEDAKIAPDEFTIAYLTGQRTHLTDAIDTLSPQNIRGVEQIIKKYS